ncbi:ADP-ribose glycohydrolase MACROD1-like [Vicugna pacos]|uniref:ADP-ribose glycohydrolase MACROD1-like n=1 Tax=Vicugna pacos TaxID=30538 RepID=A0ABM5D0F0_VICPA
MCIFFTHAKHWLKHFTGINSLNPSSSLMRRLALESRARCGSALLGSSCGGSDSQRAPRRVWPEPGGQTSPRPGSSCRRGPRLPEPPGLGRPQPRPRPTGARERAGRVGRAPCRPVFAGSRFGPLDGCIHRAAGPLLTDECRTLQSCETGKAKITCGYRLPAKYVIHTVGPIAHGEPSANQAAELRSCYLSSLDLMLEHRLRSAAFPCISTGVFGYPNEAAAEVVLSTLREWLEQHKDKVDRLIICVFLEKDENIYRQRLPYFFPVA